MGLPGLFKLLSKKGLSTLQVALADLHIQKYLLDVCAIFNPILMRCASSCEFVNEDGSFDHVRAMTLAATCIDQRIRRDFHEVLLPTKSATFTLFIDGEASAAKGYEHKKRQKKREEACDNLKREIGSLERRDGSWSPESQKNDITKLLSKASMLTMEDKHALLKALQDLGYSAILCHSEADPSLARYCSDLKGTGHVDKVAVVTIDSDLLAYEAIDLVLRPNLKGPGFTLYEKTEVYKALGLRHKNLLTLFAICHRNDYTRNIKGFGPVRTLEIIIEIQDEIEGTLKITTKGKSTTTAPTQTGSSTASGKRKWAGAHTPTQPPTSSPLTRQTRKVTTKVSPALPPSSSQQAVPSGSRVSMSSVQTSIPAVTPPSMRDLLAKYCVKVGNKKKKTISPARFEQSLRTFAFMSELRVGETPETHPRWIHLYEDQTRELSASSSTPTAILEGDDDEDDDDDDEGEQEDDSLDEDDPPPIETKWSMEELAVQFRQHLVKFTLLMRARRAHISKDPKV